MEVGRFCGMQLSEAKWVMLSDNALLSEASYIDTAMLLFRCKTIHQVATLLLLANYCVL